MITKYHYKTVTWHDVVNPSNEDVRLLFKECKLPAAFSGDLTSMTPRSEAKAENNAIKLTLDFPVVKRTDITHPHEIKFIAIKKHLITIRFEDIQAIHKFTKEFEMSALLKKDTSADGAHLLLVMMTYLYQGLEEKLDYLESKMQSVEQSIFADDEKRMLFEISGISRRLITFRHTIHTHETALDDLTQHIITTFGLKYEPRLKKLEATYYHLMRRVQSMSSTLEDLRNTNNALLTAKQNEVMKIFTIMAFVTFPLSVLTSLFGMNTNSTPLVSAEHGFWYIVAIMSILSIIFFAYFRYKRWI